MAQMVFDPKKYQYQWRAEGKNFKCKPQVAANELLKIQKQHGAITPDQVVGIASKPRNPLHKDFTWDNSMAANQWRKHEARNLIGSLVIVKVLENNEPGKKPVRAFVNVVNEESERVYIDVETAVQDDVLSNQILKYALSKAQYWLDEYRDYRHSSIMKTPYEYVGKAVAHLQDAVAKRIETGVKKAVAQ